MRSVYFSPPCIRIAIFLLISTPWSHWCDSFNMKFVPIQLLFMLNHATFYIYWRLSICTICTVSYLLTLWAYQITYTYSFEDEKSFVYGWPEQPKMWILLISVMYFEN
jgi:hypothetical protein